MTLHLSCTGRLVGSAEGKVMRHEEVKMIDKWRK